MQKAYISASNALAAGMMLSASLGLVQEAMDDHMDNAQTLTMAGFLGGFVFLFASKAYIKTLGNIELMDMNSLDTKKVGLILGVMIMHSMSEGIGLGSPSIPNPWARSSRLHWPSIIYPRAWLSVL